MTMLATMTKLFAKQLSRHIHLRTQFHLIDILTLRNFMITTLKVVWEVSGGRLDGVWRLSGRYFTSILQQFDTNLAAILGKI